MLQRRTILSTNLNIAHCTKIIWTRCRSWHCQSNVWLCSKRQRSRRLFFLWLERALMPSSHHPTRLEKNVLSRRIGVGSVNGWNLQLAWFEAEFVQSNTGVVGTILMCRFCDWLLFFFARLGTSHRMQMLSDMSTIYIHANVYSAKNIDNESQALEQDD